MTIENPAPAPDADYPIVTISSGEPVPDLAAIPRAQWRALLRAMSPGGREAATRVLAAGGDHQAHFEVLVLAAEIADDERMERSDPRRVRFAPPEVLAARAPRTPPRRIGRRRASVQLNVAITPRASRRLDRAATHLGLTRTELARSLILTGVQRILAVTDP